MAIFQFTLNNILIPIVLRTAIHYAVLTTQLKLLIIACNSSSLLVLSSLIASYNCLRSFSFKCYTQPTCFNYKLNLTFSSASLTFSLAFFLICSILSAVIFCTFTYISSSICSSSSLSLTLFPFITLNNYDFKP